MNLRRPLQLVCPTLEGDVLAVLAAGDVGLSGRAVQRAVGASLRGVQRALDHLVEQGIVLRERAGSAHIYRLNRRHLAAPWIEGLATLRLQLIDRLRESVGGWEIHPVAAVLFGSAARGEGTPSSDLDILVIRPGDRDQDDATWRQQLADLAASATAWTGNDTRVLEYGEEELGRGRHEDPVLAAAVAEGVELFGSPRRFRSSRGETAR